MSLEQNQSTRLIVECIPNLEIFCSNKDPSSAPAAAVAVFLNRLRKVFLLGSLLVAAAAEGGYRPLLVLSAAAIAARCVLPSHDGEKES